MDDALRMLVKLVNAGAIQGMGKYLRGLEMDNPICHEGIDVLRKSGVQVDIDNELKGGN